MNPPRPKYTPNRHSLKFNNSQDFANESQQILPVMNLSRYDPTFTRLEYLKDRLKAARQEFFELNIKAVEIENQLFLKWDSLAQGPEIARDRHDQRAMEHKAWYRGMRAMHRQRIEQLETEIQQETDFANWFNWSPVELLLRWKSGNMDYSIFRSHEPTIRVQEAFKLEAGLQPPKLKIIAMLSAQIAAGWYKSPMESIDWPKRIPVEDYIDNGFPEGEKESVYYPTAPTYTPGRKLLMGEKAEMRRQEREAQQNVRQQMSRPVEQHSWDQPSPELTFPLLPAQTYTEKINKWTGLMPSSNSGEHTIDRSIHDQNIDEQPFTDELSVDGNYSPSGRNWIQNYSNYEYSSEELEEIREKAFAPEQSMRVVPMIAGRPFSRPILANEYGASY